jgi:hypothetical protein
MKSLEKLQPGPGRPFEEFRWTVDRAGAEFGLSSKTVSNRIKSAGVHPGDDGKFSTKDIHAAICSDLEKAKLRKLQFETKRTEEEREGLALANAARRGELVHKADFIRRFEGIYAQMRQLIMSSSMIDAEKDELLRKIAELHK